MDSKTSAITETITAARREAEQLKVCVEVILACWRAGYAAEPVVKFGRAKKMKMA